MADPMTHSGASGALQLTFENGIAWLVMDDPEKKVNTVSTRVMEQIDPLLDRLEANPPRGLVLISGKKDSFVAGADIEELQELSDAESVRAMLQRGHALCQRIHKLPFPTVAAIHGACLGGGLELALACDLRVATDHGKTKLGLPEVQLGLFPGLGGTQRLPRLIGVADSLPLILTGKQVQAKKAKRLGMVDAVCHPADLRTAAVQLVEQGKEQGHNKGKRSLASRATNVVAALPVARSMIFGKAREGVMEKTGGHYPAPLKAIEVIEQGLNLPLEEALDLEAQAFSQLVVSDEAKNLMGIFFMKNDVEARAAALAKQSDRDISHLGVLGAGFMGSGIAQVLAYKDVRVELKDRDWESVGRGLKHCRDLFQGLVKRRKMKPVDLTLAMSRIHGTVDYSSFSRLNFVVEAVFEDVDIKHKVIQQTEEVAGDDLIFASNTSTIPIARLAEGSSRPQNVVGMHFFSPVHKMQLVEVIRHPGTSDEAVAVTVQVAQRMGKTVVVVNDGPGFFTTRVLAPFLNEASWILKQGATVEQIDKALTGWGFPVGPMALIDEVGIDIGGHVSQVLQEYFGDRIQPPQLFDRLLDDGRTGRKGGKGFYRYEKGKKKGVDSSVYELLDWSEAEPAIPDQEIIERCWMQMLNETAYCMEDSVIENPVDVDISVIFGFGFPPFRGGLLKEADRQGLAYIVERLDHYADQYGERLRPAQLLRDMAAKGETFHQD
ncbi:MAG: 3-hydroxyacyl-CoA dehydrogenase NAD-binding domain-containing protein [Acidobacteriota bacterium]|nr:3-hydroxyacyl-CoA dehydrogenase NAD-binding domain-containing protein [Acidobacteriota bacterium]